MRSLLRDRGRGYLLGAGLGAALLLLLLPAVVEAIEVRLGPSFTGTSSVDVTLDPADTMGAVGDDHIVELINGQFAVYRKSDGLNLVRESLDGFWIAAGVTPGDFAFDPRVLYDPASRRWFAVAVDNQRGPNQILVAVSSSADPTAKWNAFGIDSDSNDLRAADFPTLGLDPDGVFVAATLFPIDAGDPDRSLLIVLPKDDLLAPNPGIDRGTIFENMRLGRIGFAAQPLVDRDGVSQPTLLADATEFGAVLRNDITGPIDAPQLGLRPLRIDAPPPFSPPPNAPQPGNEPDLEAGDSRFGSSVVRQSGSLWVVHSVEVDGRAGLRWLEIDAATSAVLQDGLISDPELSFFYGSIAVNEVGDVVIGMSGSSPFQFASAYAVVGTTERGITTFGDPLLLKEGVASYDLGGDRNRWGDYSATVSDPELPRAFWTFQLWVPRVDRWAVEITRIRVPEPQAGSSRGAVVALLACLARRRLRLPSGRHRPDRRPRQRTRTSGLEGGARAGEAYTGAPFDGGIDWTVCPTS